PLMGRGTSCLEAALLGRVPYATVVNPLSRGRPEPRLDPPTSAEVAARLADYAAEGIFDGAATQLGCQRPLGGEVDDSELEVFYHPDTLRGLQALRRRFAQAPLDRVDPWLRMVATNRLSGHSPGFFSVRTMPPNQAVSVESQRKLNAKHGLVPPKRDVSALLVRKSRSLLRGLDAATRQRLASQRATARLSTDDARRMQAFADSSVQLVVTSPPFVDVVDYAGDNWLRCWFNGIDAASTSQSITTPRKADAWQDFVAAVMLELKRVLLPGGWIVFEVGEVRKGTLKLEDLVVPAARAAGLEVVALAVHKQDFTKTANCWGVANNTKGTNTQRLVILRKAVRKAVRNASNEEAGA
nr:site-specific DNA-methyltransferase [Planctomycetota bacterium]